MSKSKQMSQDATAAKQRRIQAEQDRKDRNRQHDQKSGSSPVQAGHKNLPTPPLPKQHLKKPGHEAEMELKPQFMAPNYKGSGKLTDMVAVITGGDSGIGRAVAVLYAREGADIALFYLNETDDARETKRFIEAEGRRCLLVPGDVKDAEFCQNAVENVIEQFGQIDILVNNAAFQEHADKLEDLTEERFDETMKTNVYGYFHMAKAVLPHMKEGSAIINTGSVVGLEGSSQLLDYATTKGAIHAFTKSLAANVLPRGIRVNAVAPGPVWTPLNPADKKPEDIAKFGAQTDMHRPAQPEELSPAYVFLAAPCCSSYISGIVLPVTGSIGAI